MEINHLQRKKSWPGAEPGSWGHIEEECGTQNNGSLRCPSPNPQNFAWLKHFENMIEESGEGVWEELLGPP